jgi:hypothetical protein
LRIFLNKNCLVFGLKLQETQTYGCTVKPPEEVTLLSYSSEYYFI